MDEKLKILQLMTSNEESIGELYKEYANEFPEHRDFWHHIFKEELIHAEWIRALYGETGSGKITFDKNHFPLEIVEKTLSRIKQKIKEAKTTDFPLLEALNIALKIEFCYGLEKCD